MVIFHNMLTENDRKLINTRFNVRNALQKCKQSHRKKNQVHVDSRAGSVYFIRSSDDIGIVSD